MLCCVGLIGGFAVGQYLGGPWALIAPAAGFGIGLAADMKFMKGHHNQEDQHDTGVRPTKNTDPVCGMEATMAIDPVCKMNVDAQETAPKAEYAGQTYYFCCPACRQAFTAQPEKYASTAARGGRAPGGTRHHGHS